MSSSFPAPEPLPEPHSDEEHYDDALVQCFGCKEWWPEDAEGHPEVSDWCVDNTHAYCRECRSEVNND